MRLWELRCPQCRAGPAALWGRVRTTCVCSVPTAVGAACCVLRAACCVLRVCAVTGAVVHVLCQAVRVMRCVNNLEALTCEELVCEAVARADQVRTAKSKTKSKTKAKTKSVQVDSLDAQAPRRIARTDHQTLRPERAWRPSRVHVGHYLSF